MAGMTAMHRPAPRTPHIGTLVIATAMGPLAMSAFLPSLPAMAVYFDTEYAVVQLAVSFYLVAMAVLQLVIGPASDRFGRRPVMLVSFSLFLVGTVAAINAPTIEFLLGARLLQAFAAAGMVLSRAIVRDIAGPEEAASKLGYVTMGMAVVPMIAPILGGYLDEFYGWRSTFMLILVVGTAAFVIVYFNLHETNHHKSASMSAQIGNYPELVRSRRFWGYALSAAFTSGAFFAFLGGGPYVSTEILGLRPSEYGFYFAMLAFGYMVGNFLSARFVRRVGINQMMLIGTLFAVLGMVLALAAFGLGYDHPLSLFLPAAVTSMGNGLNLPSANAGLVSVRPHLAGSASGLGGTLQIGGGAVLSIIASALLSPESGPFPLLWVMLLSSVAAVAVTCYVIHVARRMGEM